MEGECVLRDCAVKGCNVEDLPEGLRKDCEHSHLGELDTTISNADQNSIEQWTKHDQLMNDSFCYLDDENDSQAEYVDLLINPERYTGYKGPSAHKIWYSIYEENCFKDTSVYGPQLYQDGGQCLEKRSFYRMVSGLHTSINTHLSYLYLQKAQSHAFQLQKEAQFGPNVAEFRSRFHPENTPESAFRIMNLYFTYSVELKALVKVAPILKHDLFYTGNDKHDAETRQAVAKLLDIIEKEGTFFDESALFRGAPEVAGELKTEFRDHFRNISRIMDCVGCDKCRLWGKLQTQGMGTALRILFTGHEEGKQASALPSDFKLKRTEIVSLFNAFGRLATSIAAIEHFCDLESPKDSCQPDFCTAPPHNEL